MSWSASVTIDRKDAENQIDAMPEPTFYGEEKEQNAARAQFETAKATAKEMVKVIPGPKVVVTFSGHANGVGDEEKPGYSNDSLSVSMYQYTIK